MDSPPQIPTLASAPPDPDDRMGRFFAQLHRYGEHMGMWFGRCADAERSAKGERPPEWVNLPHWRYDGAGGLIGLLRERGVHDETWPTTSHPPPPLRARIKAMRQRLKRRRETPTQPVILRNAAWVGQPEPASASNAVGWKVYTREATAALLEKARSRGVSLNSLLLWSLDTTARQHWLEPGCETTRWSIPVNLRGAVHRVREGANHASTCDILLQRGGTLEAAHAAVRDELASGGAWGSWDWMEFSRWIPRAKRNAEVRKLAESAPIYTGVFSNMGRWGEKTRARGHPEAEAAWLAAPPTARMSPVTSAALIWAGRLSVTLLAHPSMGVSDADVAGWMETWVKVTEGEPAAQRPAKLHS